MNKSNVTRSSSFHMDIGDILHYILIVDGGVTPTIGLISTGLNDNQNEAPDAVVALDASDITDSSFTANWNLIENATGYYLDVATDSAFTSFVAGYEDLSVGYVSEYSVIGLGDTIDYYYRLRAINDVGIGASSNTITLTTANEVVVDGDGNIYTYVTIGTQQWLIENLRTTTYIDATAIPNLTLNADWIAEDGTAGHDGAYCWYDNDIGYKTPYGALYNWYAVDNAHDITPVGWRVPSKADWDTLIALLGGDTVAGGKLKEEGLSHWVSPNTGATNEYGFTDIPGGFRNGVNGIYDDIFERSYHWSSTEYPEPVYGYGKRTFYFDSTSSIDGERKKSGLSIRCMRDI